MFGVRIAALLLGAAMPFTALAQMTSYRYHGPIPMMHNLPVGETPGWATPNATWFNLEIGYSSIWNHQASFTDTRNSNIYTFFADYEQATAFAEIGQAFGDTLSVAVEFPYTNHNGGFTDDFVDQFHTWIGSDRFMRDESAKFGNHFVLQKNGVDLLTSEHAEGMGSIKAKIKLWLLQWRGTSVGSCDCGFSISGQAKFPTQRRDHGLSSGSNDYSGLAHLGVPIGSYSGIWATAAVTKLGTNEVLKDWPINTWQQMYELTMNLGLGENLGLLLQARAESPLMEKKYLSFNYTQSDPQLALEERVASGYNSLVEWRGSQTIGIRWRWSAGNEINFIFTEDWGIGTQDQSGDGLYINNAPDFQFATQWHFVF